MKIRWRWWYRARIHNRKVQASVKILFSTLLRNHSLDISRGGKSSTDLSLKVVCEVNHAITKHVPTANFELFCDYRPKRTRIRTLQALAIPHSYTFFCLYMYLFILFLSTMRRVRIKGKNNANCPHLWNAVNEVHHHVLYRSKSLTTLRLKSCVTGKDGWR